MTDTLLSAWKDSSTKKVVLSFIDRVSDPESSSFVPQRDRVAVFDNDGTLWCEKPIPVQADFMLERLAGIAQKAPSLADLEPYRAARERDYGWLDEVLTRHARGDDSELHELLSALLSAYAGSSTASFEVAARQFLRGARHPLSGRSYLHCGYLPMRELLSLLELRGFTTYLVSGGGRDFIRAFSEELYGIQRERVIGSSVALSFHVDGDEAVIVHEAQPSIFDEGPTKPVQIWSAIGRRPILAIGNADGDVPMLEFCALAAQPSLCALVQHDDASREYAYTTGAESAQRIAKARGWLAISMKNDWNSIFADQDL